MKKICLLNLAIFLNFAIPAMAQQSVTEEVKEIVENAKSANENLNSDISLLFEQIEKAISGADKIYQKLEKISASGEKITRKDQKVITEMVREIHNIYYSIDVRREIFYTILSKYGNNIDQEIKRAHNLIEEYEKKLDSYKANKEFLVSKRERSTIEQQDLENAETNIEIVQGTLSYLVVVQAKIDIVGKNYENVNNEIDLFLNTIKNGSETTKNLLDYFELRLEFEEILENAKNILGLDSLSKKISESLIKLAKSIEQLEKVAS